MGRRYLVTAGPTREPIDAVRFLSNRSTGKMGVAVAAAAAEAGHETRLICGPISIETPKGIARTDVETAEQMREAVEHAFGWCDVLVMTAAVADWRPADVAAGKLKKHDGEFVLRLVRTTDILESLRSKKGDRFVVGFAAETKAVEAEAMRKLHAKGLDLMVGNNVAESDAGFGVDTNRVVVVASDGVREVWPLMSKREVATRLVTLIEGRCSPP